MAKRIDTTVPPLTEPPTGELRAMFARFTTLVGSLVQLTAAERELDSHDGQEPDLAACTKAVESARACTLNHCAALIAYDPEGKMAYGMQMAAKMIRTVVATEKRSEVAMIGNIMAMRRKTALFTLYRPGTGHFNDLLDAAFDALAAHIARPGTEGAAGKLGTVPGLWDGASVAHTEMSRCFTGLLGAMDRYIRAEQMIQRSVAGDVRTPPFGQAMQRAEAALTVMHAALHRVMAAELLRREDETLWEMGYALFSLIAKDDDEARVGLFDTLIEYQAHFMAPGSHAVARRIRLMQARFFSLIGEMMQLEDHGGPGPDGDDTCGPVLVA